MAVTFRTVKLNHAIILIVACFIWNFHQGAGAPVEDQVIDLPGLPYPPIFKHYSGYLEATDGRHFHYWFVECETDPTSAPLFLWLNGGPGCSSVDGLLTGNGPFHVNSDSKTLYYNEYSWNKIANVLYLESPAGVGFSYSLSQNYSTNDDQTAKDNYAALLNFFDKFPEYESNDFYITGESYAGVYIPTLAVLVLNGTRTLNLKGLAIGNGAHDSEMNVNSVVPYAATHAIISNTVVQQLEIDCCIPSTPPTCHFYGSNNSACNELLVEAVAFVLASNVNPYGLYSDCQSVFGLSEFLVSTFGNFVDPKNKELHDLINATVNSVGLPCQSAIVESLWINQPDVRQALHIPEDVQIWKDCNDVILYSYDQQYTAMGPFYEVLLPKMPVLLYNGDTDCVCNFIGGEWFADSLGQEVLERYRPWKYNNQTAGFIKRYTNVSFATILGSGHMVPTDKPAEILYLITNFVFNKPV